MFDLDKELLEKLFKKDNEAFNEFYLKTIDIFFRYLKSNYFISDSDAQDLLSNFYFKIWNGLDNFKYNLSFQSWVRTIFKNTIIDSFKKIKELHFSQIVNDNDISFEENIEEKEDLKDLLQTDYEYQNIRKAISKLDDISKEILFLKFVEQKSNKEISLFLNISEENVRQRVSRGLKKLRQILGK